MEYSFKKRSNAVVSCRLRPPDAGRVSNDGVKKMKAARQQAIVDLLIQHKSLTTDALSAQLNVSKETIRRDLSELQAQGKVLRNHGRAKYIHRENQDSGDPFHMRLKSHFAHKADIAREALAWIEAGMVIALDASSTCWYLARQLPDIDLQVFTNSHPICL
ncbi:HTH-type transcriptional repressor glcR [Kluyvera cryocrescens]|uniref:HTH-type transcriptional repressor glcR n=1 Tax=Kluyvera cryocrescens TaxID=580 RepID=A0A485AS00_KLUCR|nr:HTH-type transcriptional repressor glcR [Kluyvera cryocrescens]